MSTTATVTPLRPSQMLVCQECKKTGIKHLGKHISRAHGMSVIEYRKKHNVPDSVSFVAGGETSIKGKKSKPSGKKKLRFTLVVDLPNYDASTTARLMQLAQQAGQIVRAELDNMPRSISLI